jgi:hypothetical protein
VIVDALDNESATAVALTVNAAGGATVKTVVLLTPEEVDAAAKRSVEYRRPEPDERTGLTTTRAEQQCGAGAARASARPPGDTWATLRA